MKLFGWRLNVATALCLHHALASHPIAPNVAEWYFMLARDLNGPIDITLAAQ